MNRAEQQDKRGNILTGLSTLQQQVTEVECALDELGSKLGDILMDNISTPSDSNEKDLKEEKIQCSIARDINHTTTRVIMIRRSLADLIQRVDI
jgi:hypothetical protein